jgi:hypothetical protein
MNVYAGASSQLDLRDEKFAIASPAEYIFDV